ncbi:MAG: GNAT family N-acetyltransferase [Christensenellaceae bacterium]|nr:GNAT family N-acetyltransferase [Christensenellaceae bacterium]
MGYRFLKEYWKNGYTTETVDALKQYLFNKTDVRKITAHVMTENKDSGSVLIKNGFEAKWKDLTEGWGFEAPVRVDKYILKK